MIWRLILEYWPVAVWILAAAAVTVRFGWRAGLGVLTLGAATVIYNQGRKDAERDARDRQQAKERRDVQTVAEKRSEAQQLPDDKLDAEVNKWTRD